MVIQSKLYLVYCSDLVIHLDLNSGKHSTLKLSDLLSLALGAVLSLDGMLGIALGNIL